MSKSLGGCWEIPECLETPEMGTILFLAAFSLPAKFHHCQDRDKNSPAHYNLDYVSLLHNM